MAGTDPMARAISDAVTGREPDREPEFAFSDREFLRIREMIYTHAGIVLTDCKKYMVYSRLARRIRLLKLKDFADYLALLERDEGAEWQAFVNALTTNLTAFFRESHHFDTLAQLAPQWYAQRGEVRVWCSASSTGEEPYSIAMTLLEALPGSNPTIRILASDLDTQVLQTAQEGIYPADRLEGVSQERRERFFLRGKGAKAGLVRIEPYLTELIKFRQINLLHKDWPIDQALDAIFCRNVMIYFDRPTQQEIVKRFHPLIQPDGRLFVGHSENIASLSSLWRACGQTTFEPVADRS